MGSEVFTEQYRTSNGRKINELRKTRRHGYSEQLELERVNVNQGYSPENCKWITHYEQTLNRRDTLYVVFGNTVIKLQDLCNEQGINKNTVNSWRYSGNLEEKLSALLGQTVTITGGKKEVVCV